MSARITSRDNPLVKRVRKLAESSRERRKQHVTLLDGVHLVSAWLSAAQPVEVLLVSEKGQHNAEILQLLNANPGIKTVLLGDVLLAELAPVDTPSGLLAIATLPSQPGLPAGDQDSLVLDGVQDPGNLGSLLRTAAAAGFRQIILSDDCTQAFSPRALRAGMGGQLLLQIYEGVDLTGFLASYRGTSIAADLKASQSLYAQSFTGPVAWVFGSEGRGVRPQVRDAVGTRVRIPMHADIESLNVAAAAAICLFETTRQRTN